MAQVTGYQVNVSFGTPPWVYVNLYKENTQVGRIEIEDSAEIPKMAFTVDMLKCGSNVEWNEEAQVLHFGAEPVRGQSPTG